MTGRIVEVSTPGSHLRVQDRQLVITCSDEIKGRLPVEDLGAVIIDNPQVTLTQACLATLVEYNVMVVTCDARHQPCGMFLPLQSHVTQTERFSNQAALSQPTRKRLWQQLIRAKIALQAHALKSVTGNDAGLSAMCKKVRSGDLDNIEAQAARRYWSRMFPEDGFRRDQNANDQNRYLNYGYAVVRALTARALCASGLHPSLGLHHHNRYNAYCLADDLMEPYRPFVDIHVYEIAKEFGPLADMDRAIREKLLGILSWEVNLEKESFNLQTAIQRSAQSLARVVDGEGNSLVLPSV